MSTCVTCPSGGNVADVALQLQYTATQAENCIFEQERLLRSALNKPTVISTSTASFTLATDAGTYTVISFRGSPTTVFDNYATFWERAFSVGGVFLVGASLNATAVAGVNDNTQRSLQIRTVDTGGLVTNSAYYTVYEANTGNGMDMSMSATFVCQPGDEGQVLFAHTNSSSDMTIAIGFTIWVTRISDATALRTV